jgi:hypothetical protein
MISKQLPHEHVSLQDCARWTRSMLDVCNTEHIACKANDPLEGSRELRTSNFVPKRLLRIERNALSYRIHLCEFEGGEASLKGLHLRYTALSHCWGSIPIIKTTAASLVEFMTEGISWACLPKTFQEAISLTRELDIQYIWIDSLCKRS